MRGGVLQLHRWGVLDAVKAAGTPAVTATSFDYGDEQITVPIKPQQEVDALFAPRRTVLDPILVAAARDAGAEFRFGSALRKVLRNTQGRVCGADVESGRKGPVRVSADLVIGADGIRSRVARLVEAPREHTARHTTAVLYGYWSGLPSEEYRWIFRPGMGVGIIPTNHGDACVFLSVTPEGFLRLRQEGFEKSFKRVIGEADPELARRLTPEHQSGIFRAFPGEKGFLRRSAGPGWALVGDAGYFKDPLTAHGMTDALRDAEVLARVFLQRGGDGMAEYQSVRDAAAKGLMEVTDAIASLAWSMEEVKGLHLDLSKAMKVGIGVIEGFEEEDFAPGRFKHHPAA
jgi:2-polyprenyl-6-methoxyphenol hydroxylase-like FAD-dependent oxidoreductase